MTGPSWCSVCGAAHSKMGDAIRCFASHTPDDAREAEPREEAGERLTGGSTDYYKVRIERPTSGGEPYMAECNDIIEALNMEYDVANVLKAAWRVAALRQGRGKPGQTNAVYDGEKIVFFGNRIVERAKGGGR